MGWEISLLELEDGCEANRPALRFANRTGHAARGPTHEDGTILATGVVCEFLQFRSLRGRGAGLEIFPWSDGRPGPSAPNPLGWLRLGGYVPTTPLHCGEWTKKIRLFRPHEVDESMLRVRPGQLRAQFVSNVQPLCSVGQKAFHVWLQDAHKCSLGSRTRDDGVEDFADVMGHR